MTDQLTDSATNTEELRSFITFRMARVQAKLNAQAMHLLRSQSDLSLVEWRVIQLLTMFRETTMSQLSREIQMDKGQLSRAIKSLVGRDIVISGQNETDARQHKLRLSPQGIALNKKLMPMMRKRQKLLVDGISEADIALFFDVLDKIDAATELRDI